MTDTATIRDITQLSTAVSRIASWAIDTTNEIASLRDEVARHHRAIDALTEQLEEARELLTAATPWLEALRNAP